MAEFVRLLEHPQLQASLGISTAVTFFFGGGGFSWTSCFFFNGRWVQLVQIHFNPKFWLKIWIGGNLVQLELFKVWNATSFLFGWLLDKRFGLPHLAFKALYYFVDILQIDCGIWMMDEHNKYTNIVVSMAHFRAFFCFNVDMVHTLMWCVVHSMYSCGTYLVRCYSRS